MGMYICKPCMSEHQLHCKKTDEMIAIDLIMGSGPVRACCELCGPLKGDWSEKEVQYTNLITRRIGTDPKANAQAELEAYKAWVAGGRVGKY